MKTQMQFANRAWRKATSNWGMGKKAHRDFCRVQAVVTVSVNISNWGDSYQNQADADYAVREELTYWGD
jgi:hypothetical protein